MEENTMPPKAKFTQEEIISAALDIARKDGLEAVTARELGNRLHSSASPIFTVFHNMAAIQQAVINEARKCYNAYVKRGLAQNKSFKGMGMQYIKFAFDEPRLFQILFMRPLPGDVRCDNILELIEDNYEPAVQAILNEYDVSEEQAKELYYHLWVYSHGISVLRITGMCQFTREEISLQLGKVFKGLFVGMKTNQLDEECGKMPED